METKIKLPRKFIGIILSCEEEEAFPLKSVFDPEGFSMSEQLPWFLESEKNEELMSIDEAKVFFTPEKIKQISEDLLGTN